jgi:hypothetical protein
MASTRIKKGFGITWAHVQPNAEPDQIAVRLLFLILWVKSYEVLYLELLLEFVFTEATVTGLPCAFLTVAEGTACLSNPT